MTKAQDITQVFAKMASQFPMDAGALNDTFRKSADLGEKVSAIALEAARSNADITSKWTTGTLDRIGEISVSETDTSDYAKAASEFASASLELATEHLVAYSEVVKKAQMETVELLLNTGK